MESLNRGETLLNCQAAETVADAGKMLYIHNKQRNPKHGAKLVQVYTGSGQTVKILGNKARFRNQETNKDIAINKKKQYSLTCQETKRQ